MTPVGFEPTTPAIARPQTYALESAATGIGASNVKGIICGECFKNRVLRKLFGPQKEEKRDGSCK
jgi:hypothetical protein